VTHSAVELARQYVGVPFRHQGRDPAIGLDCVGLLVVVFRALGHDVRDLAAYARDPHHGLLEQMLVANGGVRVTDPQPGDIALIAFHGVVRHAALVGDHADGLSLIHTYTGNRCVIEHRLDAKWRRRIVHVYRVSA
jgi:cell wall-associated NlpC family hydrolase